MMRSFGDPVTDEDRVVHILASLLLSYNIFLTALLICPRWRAVVARREEKKRGREDSGRSHLKAMTVTRLTAKESDDQQQYQSAVGSLLYLNLEWSVPNPRLYNEAFTGHARAVPRCSFWITSPRPARGTPTDPVAQYTKSGVDEDGNTVYRKLGQDLNRKSERNTFAPLCPHP